MTHIPLAAAGHQSFFLSLTEEKKEKKKKRRIDIITSCHTMPDAHI